MEDRQPNESLTRRFHSKVPSIRYVNPPRRQFPNIHRNRPTGSSSTKSASVPKSTKRPLSPSSASHDPAPKYRIGISPVPVPQRPPPAKRKKSGRAPTTNVTIDMPSDCWKGVFRSIDTRRNWVQSQISQLRENRQLNVVQHRTGAKSVEFVCTNIINPNDDNASGKSNGPHIFPSQTASQDAPLPQTLPIPTPPVAITHEPRVFSVEEDNSTPLPFQSGTWTLSLRGDQDRQSGSMNSKTSLNPPPPKREVSEPEIINLCSPTEEKESFMTSPSLDAPGPSSLRLSRKEASPTSSGDLDPSTPTDFDLEPISVSPAGKEISPPCLTRPASPIVNPDDLIIPVDQVSRSIRIPSNRGYDKPRIVLKAGHSSEVIVVSAHGFIDNVELEPLSHKTTTRSGDSKEEMVTSACLLGDGDGHAIVLGHGRPQRGLTLLSLDDQKTVINEAPISITGPPTMKTGVSALTAITTVSDKTFASSGFYDHTVRLWTMDESYSSSSFSLLAIKHTSIIRSLLPFTTTSKKLLSAGSDCVVNIFDLASERIDSRRRIPSPVYHVHETPIPFCLLFQVGHRELPFEMRDYRKTATQPIHRFGKPIAITSPLIRGAVKSHHFASGSRDGTVSLWDLRNMATPTEEFECANDRMIVQVLFHESQVLAISQDNRMWLQPVNIS